jgi:polyketide cyclase/dehydrase/lipid transport protein
MFAAHHVTIDAPYEVVSARLSHLMNWGVLHGVSEEAYEGGLETLLRVGPFGITRGLSKLVRVRALEPIRRADKTTVSLRWEATGVTGELFPVLDADLVLAPEGEHGSRVELTGTYRPPFGRAGVALDRTIMRRVAEATIRSLVDRVVATLADPAAESSTDTSPQWRPLPNLEEP